MPELPEVEVLRRSLVPHLLGRRFEGVLVRRATLREPIDRRRLARLVSRRVTELRRRAKYLLIDVEGGTTLVVHLGMSGRLLLMPRAAPPVVHEHVVFDRDSGDQLRFRDPRRFGLVAALKTAALEQDRRFRHLGIEPLGGELTGQRLHTLARGRRTPAKTFLMDAKVVVGVGNIYACEALHRAAIHPNRPAARLSAERCRRLAAAVTSVLAAAIERGGTTLNDFQNGLGDEGAFQLALRVYDREGERCRRCRGRIRRSVLHNRSTYYCPGCQR